MGTTGETRGQWILVDYLNEGQAGLLSIGDTSYHGASVRKNLSPAERDLLADLLRETPSALDARDEVCTFKGERHRVVVEPLRSPISSELVGVHAVCVPAGQDVPPRPLVGALEWTIWDDGRIETAWDDNMFRIYEIDRSGGASPTGDMNQWVNRLIAPEDRARMKLTIDAGIKDSDGKRYFVHYRILTRANTANPGTRTMEVASNCVQDPVQPLRRLRAITREVPELIPAVNPDFGDTGGLIRALFELSRDDVLAAVDTRRWQTFMTSKSWDDFGIQSPQFGYIPHVIHPDDFEAFRQTVQSDAECPAMVRFLHTSGYFRTYEVTASSGPDSPDVAEYAICRLKAVDRVP